MKTYGVKEVSKLSGVTVRTLHYYDKINLLKPINRTEVGYRYYGEEELLRLQQILFYKELDMPLKEICELLDNPNFDMIRALEDHRMALQNNKLRISTLLVTISNTIDHLKKANKMSKPEKLYEGLPKEMGTTYRQEAMKKYGKDRIKTAEESLLKLDKESFNKLKEELIDVNNALFLMRNKASDDIKVQEQIERHYHVIRTFWGTSKKLDPQADAYKGLGALYVHDERFTTIDGKAQPEFALFLKEAMSYFADTELI